MILVLEYILEDGNQHRNQFKTVSMLECPSWASPSKKEAHLTPFHFQIHHDTKATYCWNKVKLSCYIYECWRWVQEWSCCRKWKMTATSVLLHPMSQTWSQNTKYSECIKPNKLKRIRLRFVVRTQHPRQDHPLHDGGRRSLHVQVGAGDVLRCQQQQEEEGQVGRRVTDELDEGLLDEVSQSALRRQQVDLRKRRRCTELKQQLFVLKSCFLTMLFWCEAPKMFCGQQSFTFVTLISMETMR